MMTQHLKYKNSLRLQGFTLIEMAIVMVISAMILVAGLQAYDIYQANQKLTVTKERQKVLATTIAKYTSEIGAPALPCPADPTLPFTDPNAGVSNCAAAYALSTGDCTGGPGLGICKVGGRDTEADLDALPDPILIGAIPYKTIQIYDTNMDTNSFRIGDTTIDLSQDAWGFQMTYAVSQYMTVPATYQPINGAIDFKTELGVDLLAPAGSAHYALIGHGANHMGAYTPEGERPFPCVAGTTESENCDLDGIFINGLLSEEDNANYYDDTVYYTSYSTSRLWEFVPNEEHIYNTNPGNIGVGFTGIPDQRLDVHGNVKGTKVLSDMLCAQNGSNCWDVYRLGGSTGSRCPTSPPPPAGHTRVVKEIQDAQVICIDIPSVQGQINQSCPVGEFLVGFDELGNIICELP